MAASIWTPAVTVDINATAADLDFLQKGTGAVTRSVQSKLREWVTPTDYGAIGDGYTDDTDAIIACLNSGYPIDWLNLTYRVTTELTVVYSGPLNWKSCGATILMTSAGPVRAVFHITLPSGDHNIQGNITFDANSKAYNGIFFYSTEYANVRAHGLTAKNAYRSGTLYEGGNGILFSGKFGLVVLDNPVVYNSKLLATAGIPGVEGIFGISFIPDVRIAVVNNPYVEDIYSTDPTYLVDQDGIRYICTNELGDASEYSLTVNGGTIKNAWGRGIKSQAENSFVSGVTFIRTTGFSRGYGNEEVDFQEGGGILKGCVGLYKGSAPEMFVQAQQSRLAKSTPSAVIDGVLINLGTGTTLPRFLTTVPHDTGYGQNVRVSNVDIIGSGSLTIFAAFYAAFDREFNLFLSDITAAPTSRFVSAVVKTSSGATGSGTGTIKATRVINTGASVKDITSQAPGWPVLVSMTDCINFTDYLRGQNINGVTAAGSGHQAVRAIIPENAAVAGTLRPISFTLENDQIYSTPNGMCVDGNASNVLIVAVSDADKESQGVFFIGDDGVLKGTTTTNWTVSTTINDPGSGMYRMWRNNGINIRNMSGATRTFTCLLIG